MLLKNRLFVVYLLFICCLVMRLYCCLGFFRSVEFVTKKSFYLLSCVFIMFVLLVFLRVLMGLISIVNSQYFNFSKFFTLMVSLFILLCTVVFFTIGDCNDFILGVSYSLSNNNSRLVLLTVILVPLCLLSLWDNRKIKLDSGLLLLMEGLVLGVILVDNVFWFIVIIESVLIRMYFLIGFSGKRMRKVRAGYYIVIYTIIGSIFMLVGLVWLYKDFGSISNNLIEFGFVHNGIGFLILLGILVKMRIIPLHVWLGEAHVEASTEGSVILAGLMLKLGTYGYMRYVLEVLSLSKSYIPFLNLLGGLGVLYTSLTCLRQSDLKRVIAYGSIGHMSVVFVGLNSLTLLGYFGGLYQMVSHGLVSGGLIIVIGILYDRIGSREQVSLGGLGKLMPLMSCLILFLLLGNMGIRGTSGIVGEILLLLGIIISNRVLSIVALFGMFFTGVYSILLYNKVVMGNTRDLYSDLRDIDIREFSVVFLLVFFVFGLGLFRDIILKI